MRDVLGKTSTLTAEQSEAIGQQFEKHLTLIDKLVRKHITKYGGDYNDLFSRATDTIIVACRRHDAARSDLDKYIYHQIVLGLVNFNLEPLRRKHKMMTNVDEIFQYKAARESRSGDEFVEELRQDLTDDARLFLDFVVYDHRVLSRRDTTSLFRKEMLAKGWSRIRVKTAMLELRDMLIAMIEEVS